MRYMVEVASVSTSSSFSRAMPYGYFGIMGRCKKPCIYAFLPMMHADAGILLIGIISFHRLYSSTRHAAYG
jgi:hypothetical protein